MQLILKLGPPLKMLFIMNNTLASVGILNRYLQDLCKEHTVTQQATVSSSSGFI